MLYVVCVIGVVAYLWFSKRKSAGSSGEPSAARRRAADLRRRWGPAPKEADELSPYQDMLLEDCPEELRQAYTCLKGVTPLRIDDFQPGEVLRIHYPAAKGVAAPVPRLHQVRDAVEVRLWGQTVAIVEGGVAGDLKKAGVIQLIKEPDTDLLGAVRQRAG